jgi:hypothetical protein
MKSRELLKTGMDSSRGYDPNPNYWPFLDHWFDTEGYHLEKTKNRMYEFDFATNGHNNTLTLYAKFDINQPQVDFLLDRSQIILDQFKFDTSHKFDKLLIKKSL